jgi:hypothetical protein
MPSLELPGQQPSDEPSATQPSVEQTWALRIFREQARAWIWERTIGLYLRQQQGDPVMYGSGVLLRIADAAFVLTAGHILKEVIPPKVREATIARRSTAALNKASREEATCPVTTEILVGPMAKGSHLTRLVGEVHVVIADGHSEVDAGFIRLPAETVQALAEHKKFLRMSDLELHLWEPNPGRYCLLGFPAKDNTPNYLKKEIDALPFCYLTRPILNALESTPGISFLLELTNDKVIFHDSVKSISEERRMPELKGISGCGVWRLYGDKDVADRLDRWDSSRIKLVGIEYAWMRRKWVRCVFIQHLIELIRNFSPDLHSSMSIIW